MSIVDDLIKKRTHVACDYDQFSLDSVNNGFVFKNISANEIENYIETINPNKSVRSGVPSICFVKLSAKIYIFWLPKIFES